MILHDPITRLRASVAAGPYGNQTPNWSSPATADYLVHWSAKSVSEVVGDQARTITRVMIFCNPDVDLEATDRVVFEGDTYEIDGDIMRSFRRGQPHHVRAFLRRIATTGS